jgi:hypothetical protein
MSNNIARQEVIAPDGQSYWVSTINRQSSSIYNPCMYAETIVWECTAETFTDANGNPQRAVNRGAIVWQGEASEDSTRTHDRAVEALTRGGLVALDPPDTEEEA